MNETLIDNWNSVVGKEDVVFHLGDFCLGGASEWINILERLHGKIHLILGNHDLKNWRPKYAKYFWEVTMQEYIKVDNHDLYLHHYPFLHYADAGHIWQLFGHVHTGQYNIKNVSELLPLLHPTQYDVGVDNNNFTPISFAQIRNIIEHRMAEGKE